MKTATLTKFKETEIGLIPEEWGFGQLKDFCGQIQYGFTQSASLEKVGPKFLRITDIQDSHITWDDVPFCEVSEADHKKYRLTHGDIVIARTGASTGANTIYKNGMPDAVFASYLIRVKTSKELDPTFTHYYLQSDFYKDYVAGILGGSAQPNANAQQLTEVKISVPKVDEQKQIAEILSSLDDKIELNLAINTNFEKLAGSLFKKWFVDIGDELPEGWEIKSLDDVANFLNGLALQKYPAESDEDYLPVIKIRELNNGITDATDKASTKIPVEYILKNGDIVFSWSGSLDVVIWCNGHGALNQHLFKVTSDQYPKWFYYQWIKYFLPTFQGIASDKAVTMGHIKRGHLTESKVLVPNDKALQKMDALMSPIVEALINNSVEISNLINIRNSLLPRLMSGKIRVNI